MTLVKHQYEHYKLQVQVLGWGHGTQLLTFSLFYTTNYHNIKALIMFCYTHELSVEDPGFPRGWRQLRRGGANLLFDQFSLKTA